MYKRDIVYYFINNIFYFVIFFSDLSIFATFMIILAFKMSILNWETNNPYLEHNPRQSMSDHVKRYHSVFGNNVIAYELD